MTLYKSDHKRDTRSWRLSDQCTGIANHGGPCRLRAIRGKTRCQHHGGSGSKTKTYKHELKEARKALREQERMNRVEIGHLRGQIRRRQRDGAQPEEIASLERIIRGLLTVTQQKDEHLASSFVLPLEEQTARKIAAETLYRQQFSSGNSKSIDLTRYKAKGVLLGGAVGEAVGITLQGQPRGTYREIPDMWGGGIFDLEPGEWAADTAMMMALTESLIQRGSFEETDFMNRLTEWYEEGAYSGVQPLRCVGIGELTENAIMTYRGTGDPVASSPHPRLQGNGSLVRIAPVAVRYWNDLASLREVARRQCLTTHASAHAVSACIAFAEVMADAIAGLRREDVLRPRHYPGSPSIDFIMTSPWDEDRDSIRSNNDVLNSLEAAMWCISQTTSFQEAVLLAANLGEDAGTTAALTGQLAGALYGPADIPEDWLSCLEHREHIEDQAEALFDQTRPFRRKREEALRLMD